MTYLSENQRVEMALPAMLFRKWAHAAADLLRQAHEEATAAGDAERVEKTAGGFRSLVTTVEHLDATCAEAFAGLSADQAEKLDRRARRVAEALTEPYLGTDGRAEVAAARAAAKLRGQARAVMLKLIADKAAAARKDMGANMLRLFVQLAGLLHGLIEEGHLTLTAGSRFDIAYEALKGTVVRLAETDEDIATLMERVDKSATKGAVDMRAWLVGQGYYRPVAVGRAA